MVSAEGFDPTTFPESSCKAIRSARWYNSWFVAPSVDLNVIEIGPATENEMIAAFLRAEIDSSRYGNNFVKTGLAQLRLERNIIDAPNLADAVENDVRRQLMRYRGY